MTTNQNAREWDAGVYHQISEPQFEWGKKVLARLPLAGGERVIDAGCGTGRLTAEVLERLPSGSVLAIDGSQNMLEKARAYLLPKHAGKVDFLCADLAQLQLEAVADAVFSTATFHWIADHDALFSGLFRALRSPGRLVVQCGGYGNLSQFLTVAQKIQHSPKYAQYFREWEEPHHFARPEDTERRLQRAGFEKVKAWLEEAPVQFANGDAFGQFIRTVVLRSHLLRLPDESLRDELIQTLVDESAKQSAPFLLDYWRLNMDAQKR